MAKKDFDFEFDYEDDFDLEPGMDMGSDDTDEFDLSRFGIDDLDLEPGAEEGGEDYADFDLGDLDLGEDGKAVTGASVRALDINTDGVKLAERIRVYVSTDGSTGSWQNMGRVKFEPTGDRSVSTATVMFDQPVDCRYVRFSVSIASNAHFFFLDEVEVYADVDPAEQVNNGDAVYLAGGVDARAWKKLSTGKAATVVDSANVAYKAAYSFKNCTFDSRAPENKELLTDGARTPRRFGDDVWWASPTRTPPPST